MIMLNHEVMAVDERHDNGPQDLVTISVHSIAINKMQLYSLPVAYACTYYNLTATMGHCVHNIDISKLLAHTTQFTQYS